MTRRRGWAANESIGVRRVSGRAAIQNAVTLPPGPEDWAFEIAPSLPTPPPAPVVRQLDMFSPVWQTLARIVQSSDESFERQPDKGLARHAESLSFTVLGNPVPQGRPRCRIMWSSGDPPKPYAHVYEAPESKAYQKVVARHAREAADLCGWTWSDGDAFEMSLIVYHHYPQKHGDGDNYLKAVSDALNGIAWKDDKFVAKSTVELVYDSEHARVEVEVIKR